MPLLLGYHPLVYFVGDLFVHLAPVVTLMYYLTKHKRWVRPQHGAMALLGQVFFAYSQAGKLDCGEIYVPHDVAYAWTAGALGQLLAPSIVNNCIKQNYRTALSRLALVFAPYIIKKLGLRTWTPNKWDLGVEVDGDKDDTVLPILPSPSGLQHSTLCKACLEVCCAQCRAKMMHLSSSRVSQVLQRVPSILAIV